MFAAMSIVAREERERAIKNGEDPDKVSGEVAKTAVGIAVGSLAGIKGAAIGGVVAGPPGAFLGFIVGTVVGGFAGGVNPERTVSNVVTGAILDVNKPK